ncbi:hypothetical protein C4K03_5338 [Pseudomonas synxantha]|uniref:Uncharacterized protein n=1 Tax=Pseudomonas synxantha TaxID=47883 RepID=A0A3G7UFY4_9PSED|nr:hypothetical protein C4K03_5338 [Pseudomonas synxantha]
MYVRADQCGQVFFALCRFFSSVFAEKNSSVKELLYVFFFCVSGR